APDEAEPSGRSGPPGETGVAADGEPATDAADLPWPEPTEWVERVRSSTLAAQRALVVEFDLVYLQRYHAQEVQVVADLLDRAGRAAPAIDEARLADGLARRFGDGDADQRDAAARALRSWTTVITGGPGTGKTTTAATILALLAEQTATGTATSGAASPSPGDASGSTEPTIPSGPTGSGALSSGQVDSPGPAGSGRPLRIGLAAPTGKAAARMQEALTAALVGTPEEPGIIAATPPHLRDAVAHLAEVEAVTLHRLLGKRPDSGTRFRHDRSNRLPHDVVLVDEASMVSLTHMARLLEALRPQTRLILVGDPDQLVSVDAGAVLADLVAGAEASPDSAPVALARLRKVYRYGEAIGALAQALRDGDADRVVELLAAGRPGSPGSAAAAEPGQVVWVDAPDPAGALEGLLTRQARAIYERAQAGDATGALDALGRHRLLCAHRRGEHGVATWNTRIEGWLREATGDGLFDPMYVGRPLLVTANDYATGVVNGDTGVVVAAPTEQGVPSRARRARRVAVIAGAEAIRAGGRVTHPPTPSSGAYRTFAPSRLGDVDTLHAMTIHKAQGSQAESVTVLLPEADSPLLTRELLYTGITRASRQVRVVGPEVVVRAAVERRVVRASGLRQRLAASP
ncbi:exodeoxyribonuclease V subunit alpha, partial [Piscicoccus intestinalis]|uniref:exodeoxyribonuclease V subunit alpha n=1 Tax=Piscicoccus intestinalis TaxID=746033 RepID=UPI000837B948